jgi:hypothetical protein
MTEDFYATSARQRLEQIQAERAAAEADLLAHKSNGDSISAAGSIQQLANLAAEQDNLSRLWNSYAASQQPQPAPYVSPEERQARPVSRMDWQDVVDMTRQSRYAKNIRSDDPALVAGWHEAQRRRARGE